MKLSKFLSITIFITCLCLFYVHLETEVFRLAYIGQKKQAAFEELLDKNSILRYNIGRNASLISIVDKISRGADFQMPDTYRLVRLAPTIEGLKPIEQPTGKQKLVLKFFSIKRQAEARTLNP